MAEIYLITNTVNSNRYVGKTKGTAKSRFVGHVYDAKHGSNTNIAKAIKKYGSKAFVFEALEKVEVQDLDDRERFYIAAISPEYNMTGGGEGGDTGMKGSKWINNGSESFRLKSGETIPDGFVFGRLESSKAKMRHQHSKISAEGCENMRQARLKFRHTEETKAKMSVIRKEIWRQMKAAQS